MRSNSVLQTDQAYKRGLILGLTMAEIVLLLLFSLLLALAALFWEQERKMEEVVKERDKLTEELRINEKKLETLMATLSRTDLSAMKKELVRLKEQEEKIAMLIERLEIDEDAPSPEKVSLLVEKVTKLSEVSKKIEAAGFPPEPAKLSEALDRVKDAQQEIAKTDAALEKAQQEKEQLTQTLEDAEQGIAQKDGQIANMKRTLDQIGKGTEKPACWADEKTGKPKYIYNTGLTSEGIIVRLSATPPWAKARELPINSIPFDKDMTPREFLREANPMFEWSEKNECRFFVRTYDLTGPTEKKIYKRHMRYLESAFYKYEVLDDHWE
jgi:septal ring factor EnvC (AmiA/AmiB activator)